MKDENIKHELIERSLASLDAPLAAPEHHRVIFENERVRVMELKVDPGEVVPVHTHRWTSVNYVVKHSDFLSFDADGNVKLDSRTDNSEIKEGAVFCLPPYPPPHSVENIGTSKLHGISVELKGE
jgi:quercetin dioxygenase-like cupin family protein